MQNDKIKKKSKSQKKILEKKPESTWVNSTNPSSMIWNQDKKIRLSKERSSKKDWS